jgi:hypothetical protein
VVEILFVLATCAALATVALVPWILLLQVGAAVAAAGMAIGVPAGLLYHLRLRDALVRAGHLPRHWWLSPVSHHHHLDGAGQGRIRPSFYLGAFGFLVTALGCVVTFLGVVGSFTAGADPL